MIEVLQLRNGEVWNEALIAEFEPLLMVANARIDRILAEFDSEIVAAV